jgi:hypothetical protein
MASKDLITINIKTRGQYQTDAHHLDALIYEYLPASVADLRRQIAAAYGVGCQGHYDDDFALTSGVGIGEPAYCEDSCAYSDLTTVTECLMVLAELRGYATN